MRLEGGKYKTVYQDVSRIEICPLCTNTSFTPSEPSSGIEAFKPTERWLTRSENIGFVTISVIRTDKGAEL